MTEAFPLKWPVIHHIPSLIIVNDFNMNTSLTTAIKGGTARREMGQIVHLVPNLPDNPYSKAECGAVPGKTGFGWVKTDKEASCLKCLKGTRKIHQE